MLVVTYDKKYYQHNYFWYYIIPFTEKKNNFTVYSTLFCVIFWLATVSLADSSVTLRVSVTLTLSVSLTFSVSLMSFSMTFTESPAFRKLSALRFSDFSTASFTSTGSSVLKQNIQYTVITIVTSTYNGKSHFLQCIKLYHIKFSGR